MRDIYKVLNNLAIEYRRYEHPAVFTVEAAEEHYAKMLGAHTKNLFLRNKKGNRHYLVAIESSKNIDLKQLREFLNESNLSFASAERLQKYLGLTPGSVSILGLMNDENKEVQVVIDTDLLKEEIINCHPNINTATLGIRTKDIEKFLKFTGHVIREIEV